MGDIDGYNKYGTDRDVNKDEIVYKFLSEEDLKSGLLDEFNRYQKVSDVWRIIDSEKKIIHNPFVDDWDKKEKDEIVEEFKDCIHKKGSVITALHKGKIIAFACISGNLFGSLKQYADLIHLYVSKEYRHLGLGRKLFHMCAEEAKSYGAHKLYISAHSSVESQAFYNSLGCTDAEEINKHHAEMEPYDFQMEYKCF